MQELSEQLINMGWLLTKYVTIPIIIGWIIIKIFKGKQNGKM